MEPTFQHCCCRSRAMARLSTVCTMAMLCYVLTLAVALSLRQLPVLPQPRAIRPDPSWGRWRVSNWWEILSSCASCSCRVVVCQHLWPPRTYINQASIHPSHCLAGGGKKKDNSRSTAQHSTGTAQAHCTTEQDRTRQGTAHNNDNNNKTRLPCPNGKVAVCRWRLLYAGSSHFSWPHLANPSDLPQALVGDRQPASQLNKRIGRQTSATPPPKVFPGRGPPELHRLHAVGSLCCNLFPRSPPPPLPVLSVLSCLVQPSLIQSSRAEPSPVPCSYPCAVSSSRRSRDSVQWWLSLPISLPACSPVPISAALD